MSVVVVKSFSKRVFSSLYISFGDKIFTLKGYPFDSNEITADASATLKANAEFLKNNKGIKVQVEGHCDERGSIQYNLALGEKRAKATRDFLAAEGVESARISVISYGKEKAVAYGHDDAAWSKNRRSNFVITEK